MKTENAIEVYNITKKFKVYLDRGHTLKELVLFKKRRQFEEREVLKGISFEVKKGEAIGLIGKNGCGKSTTLKLLTKIMYPDSGSIEMKGRVSSLIELGAGFHPDMSGRQNIYTNASIFGLSRKEIDARLDDIIAFSELNDFIDNPVRTYSSGMYMRLAFAVAINVDADILLIDEILAVGDANFQAKCFNKLKEIKAKGTTIVIVSHSLGQIEQICEKTFWIDEGKIRLSGSPREVHPQYMDYMEKLYVVNVQKEEKRKEKLENSLNASYEEKKPSIVSKEDIDSVDYKRWGNRYVSMTKILVLDENGKERRVYRVGEKIRFKVFYKVDKNIENACFGIGIFREDGVQCYGTNTMIDKCKRFDIQNDGYFEIEIERLNLLQGYYNIDFAIEHNNGLPVDYYREAINIEVMSNWGDIGVVRVEHKWHY